MRNDQIKSLKELAEIEKNSNGKVIVLWENILKSLNREIELIPAIMSDYDQSEFKEDCSL